MKYVQIININYYHCDNWQKWQMSCLHILKLLECKLASFKNSSAVKYVNELISTLNLICYILIVHAHHCLHYLLAYSIVFNFRLPTQWVRLSPRIFEVQAWSIWVQCPEVTSVFPKALIVLRAHYSEVQAVQSLELLVPAEVTIQGRLESISNYSI